MGEGTTVLGLVGDTSALDTDSILRNPCIERIMKVQEPYKLANRKMHPEDTIVTIGGKVQVGGKKLVVMAGPCSVESKEQILETAQAVKAAGATVLRGGAWKPRSSPTPSRGIRKRRWSIWSPPGRRPGCPSSPRLPTPPMWKSSSASAIVSRWARATCRILNCSRSWARPTSPSAQAGPGQHH